MQNLLNMIATIWGFLDGKKTIIGATMVLIASVLTQIESTWMFHQPFIDGAISLLNDWGTTLTKVGVGFKGANWLYDRVDAMNAAKIAAAKEVPATVVK